MAFLSFILFLVFLFLGHSFPRKMGWAMIILVPLLATGSLFTMVPAQSLPLTMHRIAFAVSIGMLVKHANSRLILSRIFKGRAFVVVLIFMITYGLSAVREEASNTIFTYIPNLIYPILIPVLLIKSTHDLFRLVKIFTVQAVIICGFILIEYFFNFNIGILLAKTNPNVNYSGLWEGATVHIRSGTLRMGGIDGHPVYTGYRLAFLFPLILWYQSQERLKGLLYLVLLAISLLFLQARAAMIVTVILFGLINVISMKGLLKNIVVGVLILLVFSQIPFVKKFSTNFYNSSFSQVTEGLDNAEMAQRFNRIPYALNAFLNQPYWGYGSKKTVLYKVMPKNDNDLPAPIMYLVAGGLIVGLTYVLIFLGMILSVYNIRKKVKLPDDVKLLTKYIQISLLGGFLVLCVNTAEAHVNVMLMLYTATYTALVIVPDLKAKKKHPAIIE